MVEDRLAIEGVWTGTHHTEDDGHLDCIPNCGWVVRGCLDDEWNSRAAGKGYGQLIWTVVYGSLANRNIRSYSTGGARSSAVASGSA